MTFTANQIRLPANVTVPVGHFARFTAHGHFMRVDSSLHNGLGYIYQANRDGTFSRVFF